MKLSWREVLDCKIPGMTIYAMADEARRLQYPYFCHNGRIYEALSCGGRLVGQVESDPELGLKCPKCAKPLISGAGGSGVKCPDEESCGYWFCY